MRYVNYIVAIAALAATVAGCADPYYPRYGNSQAYYSQSGYSYPANSYPVSYSYPATTTIRPTTATDRAPGIVTTAEFTLGRNEPFLRGKA
jgi:hypothetical protein